jgi:hypothetical protein
MTVARFRWLNDVNIQMHQIGYKLVKDILRISDVAGNVTGNQFNLFHIAEGGFKLPRTFFAPKDSFVALR